MILSLIFIIFLVIACVFMIYQNFMTHSFAPWVPSHMRLLHQALTWIQPTAGQTFIDLGCGDGRAVLVASKNFHLQATGVDINPVLTFYAKLMLALNRQKATIITGNLYQQDLSTIDILYIYGLPKALASRLQQKISQELRPGSWIISYNFSLHDRQPIQIFQEKWRKVSIYKV